MLAFDNQTVLLMSLAALFAAGLALFVGGWVLFVRERRGVRAAAAAIDSPDTADASSEAGVADPAP